MNPCSRCGGDLGPVEYRQGRQITSHVVCPLTEVTVQRLKDSQVERLLVVYAQRCSYDDATEYEKSMHRLMLNEVKRRYPQG